MESEEHKSCHHSGPPAPRPVEVAAGLIFRDGKLLITQRHADTHLGGLWEFPGGKRETEETYEQCLVRELREELGVEVRVGEAFEAVSHSYPEKTVHLKFYCCQMVAGEPQPLGCAALKWVSQQELKDYVFLAADSQLIRKLATDWGCWQR